MSKDLAEARKVLKANAISNRSIKPSQLVTISHQLNKSLQETLNLIAFLKMNGQGYSPFPQTAKVLTGSYQ